MNPMIMMMRLNRYRLVRPWIAVDAEMYDTPYLAVPFTRQTDITQRMPINAEQSIDDANLPPKARAHSWRPTNGIEMKAFIGIILAMGILKKPTLESY
jgi:hypothetical protein